MVIYLDPTHNPLPENGFDPIGCIWIAHFWVQYNPNFFTHPDLAAFVRRLYTGPILTLLDPQYHQPPPIYEYDPANSRPPVASLNEFADNGLLFLPPGKTYTVNGPYSDSHNDYRRYLVITAANQTGDIPHVACALAHDPLLDVLILIPEGKKSSADQASFTYWNAIREQRQQHDQPYESLLNVNNRVHEYQLLSENDPNYIDFYSRLSPVRESMDGETEHTPLGRARFQFEDTVVSREIFNNHSDLWSYENKNEGHMEYVMMSVGGCTLYDAVAYRDLGAVKFLDENSRLLTSPTGQYGDLTDDDLVIWAGGLVPRLNLGVNAERKTICMIWSRYSGSQPGGYNPAGDSDVKGQQQLIDLANSLGFYTVTVGHDPSPTEPTPHGKLHLGEFWATGRPFQNRGRPGQASFYKLLLERHNVMQIGQKTGGMDNAALVGIPTVYIEDSNSPSVDRMGKWTAVMAQYKSAIITYPPTPIGKALRVVENHDGFSDPAANLEAAKKLLAKDPAAFPHGYEEADVKEKISPAIERMRKYFIFNRK